MCLGKAFHAKPVREKLVRTLWCPRSGSCLRVCHLSSASFHTAGAAALRKKKTKPNPKTLALGQGTAVFLGGKKKKNPLFFSLQTLGHIGKVIKVYGDGDLRVSVGGQSWTFNPACLTAYQREEEANLMTTESAKESKSEGQVWAPRGWQLLDPALWMVVKSRCCSVDGELKPSCALLGKQSLGKCRV